MQQVMAMETSDSVAHFSPEGTGKDCASPITGSPVENRNRVAIHECSPLSAMPPSLQNLRRVAEASPPDVARERKRPVISRWPSSARWSSLKGSALFESDASSNVDCDNSSSGPRSRTSTDSSRHSSLDGLRSFFSSRGPSPLVRANSLLETKMLFERSWPWRRKTIPEVGVVGSARPDQSQRSTDSETSAISEFGFHDHFTWEGKLGSGSFAEVYAVSHKSRPTEKYAIKCFKEELHSRAVRADRLREAEIANQLTPHPNVITYYRAWQDERRMYVQMELCDLGSLRDQMGVEPFNVPSADITAWKVIRHMAAGLAHIHALEMLHCDIKPENVLVKLVAAQPIYKLGDLGQATFLAQWEDGREGDAKYLAKDLLGSQPSTAADIFSLGIMMYEAKSGAELPGHGEDWDALRMGMGKHIQDLVPLKSADVHLMQAIEAMMAPNPECRPSADAISEACPPDETVDPQEPGSAESRGATNSTGIGRRGSQMSATQKVLRWLAGPVAALAREQSDLTRMD